MYWAKQIQADNKEKNHSKNNNINNLKLTAKAKEQQDRVSMHTLKFSTS